MSSILKVDTIQNTAGTSALTIDSSGRVAKPVTPYLYLRGNSATRVTDKGTAEVYTNWNVTTTIGGMAFDSSNGRITVPVDGVYIFSAKFYFWMDDASTQGVMVRKNGSTIQEYFTDLTPLGGGSITDHTVTTHEILNLTTSDYIDYSCDADIYGGSNHTNLQAVMIG